MHLLKTAIAAGQTDAKLQLVTLYRTSGTGPGHHDGGFNTSICNKEPEPAWLAGLAANGYQVKVERIDCVLITAGRFTFLAPLSHVVLDALNDHTIAFAQCGNQRSA